MWEGRRMLGIVSKNKFTLKIDSHFFHWIKKNYKSKIILHYDQPVKSWNLVRIYISSSCHNQLTQTDEIVRTNSKIVKVVTLSMAIGKIKYIRFVNQWNKNTKKIMRNSKSHNLWKDKEWMHLSNCKRFWAVSFKF